MKSVGIVSVLFALISVMDAFDQHLRVQMLMDDIMAGMKSDVSCPSHPAPLVPLPSPLPDNITNAIQAVEKIFSDVIDDNTPGVAVGIQYMDTLQWTKGFGAKDVVHPDVPPDADTIFRIASITKVFVVITLYQLFEQGEVKSLDEPLTNYCPDFTIRNPYQMDDVVTLRQLASQLSGMPHEAPCYNSSAHFNYCPMTTAQILERLKSEYRNLPSWTRPAYSNLAYSLLGNCLIEKTHGSMQFKDYVQQFILKPLGMTNTGFDFTQDVISKMATGYLVGGLVAPLFNLGWDSPAGQMYSTVNDLLKLASFLNSMYVTTSNPVNKILSPHLVREMGLPMFLNTDGKTLFGSPWEMMFIDTYLVRTKSGNLPGYSAQFSYVPELGLSIVALVNGNKDMEEQIKAAYEAVIPEFKIFEAANMAKVPYPPDPDVYFGNYSCPKLSVMHAYANIYSKGDVLLVDFSLIDGANHYQYTTMLRYHQALELQIYFDTSQINCLAGELLALNYSWLYFDPANSSGKSPGFYFPWLQCRMSRTETTV